MNNFKIIRKYICDKHNRGCRAHAIENEDSNVVIKGEHNHVPEKIELNFGTSKKRVKRQTCRLTQSEQDALKRLESCPKAARNKDGEIPAGLQCNMDGKVDPQKDQVSGADPMWERPKGREYDTGTPPRETDGICC